MFTIGSIGFTAPALLFALLALPILWFLLRAIPPAPIRRHFPGIALLLGLTDDEHETDKTPWWLLLLRCLAVALAILAFAGPVLNPDTEDASDLPLLVLTDGTWASGSTWAGKTERIDAALEQAGRQGRTVAVVSLTDLPAGNLPFQTADTWIARLPSLAPQPWVPRDEVIAAWADSLTEEERFETFWVSDGVGYGWRDGLLAALERQGPVRAFESPRSVFALRPAYFEDGLVKLSVLRNRPDVEQTVTVAARGLDPAGIERDLARVEAEFAAGDTLADIDLSLPSELRNRVTRFEVSGERSAGAVSLTDDGLRRREIALIAGRDEDEEVQLLSPLHYLRQALEPTADLLEGALEDVLLANPDAIILADVATLSEVEADGVQTWVEEGGFLVRFAGPRLAASDIARAEEEPLLPVRLRVGGRTVGGAMSWGEPKTLQPFAAGSPFFGLPVYDEVTVTSQVMAQPDPELADRVIASLQDGTPLITLKSLGQGQVILFHVTANAEWSTLPLSGLFVQMLERLAISTRSSRPDATALAGTTWVPERLLDGFGQIIDAEAMAGIPGEVLAEETPGPDLPPGLYAGEDQRIAVNAVAPDGVLDTAVWPDRIPVEGLDVTTETPLKGWVLSAALALLLADVLASLWLAGRLTGPREAPLKAAAAILAAVFLVAPELASAQSPEEDDHAVTVTSEVVLAYVETGDPRLDETSRAGLRGLSDRLYRRTSVEPAEPVGVNLETDELSFLPFLYWPVTPDQPQPSAEAYAKLNRYLRTGGMIMFDTRDADVARFGQASPEGRKLQALARPLDIPPLEPIPGDHVLTRTFYLLQDFPGRHSSRDVWVEAAPPDAELAEGMPFRNLNDGVTPVVIGGNDWATAWAIDESGRQMFPVGRGFSGERQREVAYRFGINLIMHVLTGNYKSDQVHVPALLDRLGQ
ncbi:MAG: DUF4159 domain-containing protein [Pseudomonadota bacterium]